MIFPRSTRHGLVATLAAIAILVRMAIPTGFMPSSVGDGWYLQVCPDGMPAEVMVALFGESHAHHGEHEAETFFQCDYDSGVVGDLVVDGSFALFSDFIPNHPVKPGTEFLFAKTSPNQFRPRAPPEHSRLI